MTRQRFLALSFMIAALVTALLAPTASGQGCRSGRFAYSTPVYSTPTYSYTPAYVAPSYEYPPIQATVIVQEVLSPAYVFQVLNAFQAPAPANTVPYQPAMPASPCQNATVRLDPAQLAELAALLRGPAGGDARNLPAADSEPPPFGDLAVSAAAPTNNTAEAEIKVLRYFGTACARCHQEGQSPRGGVVLFDASGYFKPSRTNGQPLPLSEIVAAVRPGSGRMPKDGQPMPPDLFAAIPAHWHGRQTAYNH